MDTDALFNAAGLVTTHEASRITGKHINTIRNGIAEGRLLARKFGRDYQIPIIYEGDTAYLVYRASKGDQ